MDSIRLWWAKHEILSSFHAFLHVIKENVVGGDRSGDEEDESSGGKKSKTDDESVIVQTPTLSDSQTVVLSAQGRREQWKS